MYFTDSSSPLLVLRSLECIGGGNSVYMQEELVALVNDIFDAIKYLPFLKILVYLRSLKI